MCEQCNSRTAADEWPEIIEPKEPREPFEQEQEEKEDDEDDGLYPDIDIY